ncbi:MAG: NfeD family protein [Rhodospirillales bacterium]|nr:NfeD family protein [Rhodospirillales bacterium]
MDDQLVQYLEQLTFWHWFILGVVLAVLEMFAPGVVFLWLGIAAGVTGIVLLAVPDMSWQFQALSFAVLAVVCVLLGRHFVARRPPETDHPTLNRRAEQYVGQVHALSESVRDGRGKIVIDDTMWSVRGDDLPKGARVKVVAIEGADLIIEKADG